MGGYGAESFEANISRTACERVLRHSGPLGGKGRYDPAKFQGHLLCGHRVIRGQRSNFDLEYLRQGATCDLEIFIVGDLW